MMSSVFSNSLLLFMLQPPDNMPIMKPVNMHVNTFDATNETVNSIFYCFVLFFSSL